MNPMKKWLMYGLLLCSVSIVLAACSDEKEEAAPSAPAPSLPQEEEIVVPAVEDEEVYKKVVNGLLEAGFTVGEPAEASIDMFKAESGMILTINGDALLPLHLYKLDPSDERLAILDKTGNLPVYLGSKTEQLAVKRLDNFVIHLHKAHPDYEEIMKVIDDI